MGRFSVLPGDIAHSRFHPMKLVRGLMALITCTVLMGSDWLHSLHGFAR
jgi:hypothetical protein